MLGSIILAGLRRNTGYVLAYETSDLRNYIRKYLGWGEFFFDRLSSLVKRSAYFKKESKIDGVLRGARNSVHDISRNGAYEDFSSPRETNLD